MTSRDVLTDAFGRIQGTVHSVLRGITDEQLVFRPDRDSNTVAWLIWHLSRIQDDHVSDAAGESQVWVADGWAERFGLPFEAEATGYGMSADEVAQVKASAELLAGYYEAVHRRSLTYIAGLSDSDLDRIVDTSWNPPVTLGVRLISVLADDLQHAGQASYVRGIARRAL